MTTADTNQNQTTNDDWQTRVDGPTLIRGRALRFVLVDLMRRHPGPVTVKEMIAALEADGYEVAGRASKTISDALRWERARGRVVRVDRGVYHFGRVPKTTGRRIRVFAARCRDWVVAVTRSQVHGSEPSSPSSRHGRPLLPAPWDDLNWLWAI